MEAALADVAAMTRHPSRTPALVNHSGPCLMAAVEVPTMNINEPISPPGQTSQEVAAEDCQGLRERRALSRGSRPSRALPRHRARRHS